MSRSRGLYGGGHRGYDGGELEVQEVVIYMYLCISGEGVEEEEYAQRSSEGGAGGERKSGRL